MATTDGPGDPGDAAARPDPATGPQLVVPDDASALEADRLAWLAEDRTRRRRARLRRLVLTRRWDRFGLSGPLVVLVLLLVAGVGALAVVLVPRPPTPPPSAGPLAAVPALAVPPAGAVPSAPVPAVEPAGDLLGRRLPEVTLAGDVAPVPAARLRPAVVLVVPPDCGCEEAVGALYRQAREFRLTLWLLGAPAPDGGVLATQRTLAGLDARRTAGGARWAVDGAAAVGRAVRSRGLTVLLVRRDGVVVEIVRDVAADGAVPALEIPLAALAPHTRRTS